MGPSIRPKSRPFLVRYLEKVGPPNKFTNYMCASSHLQSFLRCKSKESKSVMTSPTPSSFDVRVRKNTRMPCHVRFFGRQDSCSQKMALSIEERRKRDGTPRKSQTYPSVPTDKNSTIFIPLSSSLRREVSKNEDTATRRQREGREREAIIRDKGK